MSPCPSALPLLLPPVARMFMAASLSPRVGLRESSSSGKATFEIGGFVLGVRARILVIDLHGCETREGW